MSAMDSKGQGEMHNRKIIRLEEMRENLARSDKDLRDDDQEKWARVRDTALGTLDQARQYFLNAAAGELARET